MKIRFTLIMLTAFAALMLSAETIKFRSGYVLAAELSTAKISVSGVHRDAPLVIPPNPVYVVVSVKLDSGRAISMFDYTLDAFGHEVAPRTKHLMTEGPYRLSRNPMLTGTFVYLIGICTWLWTWQALAVFIIFVVIMLVQVRTEESRLRRDFGEEYEVYCRRTGRFLPF